MKHYYRSPKTTQEKRANQENWHRGKRSPRKLGDTYWDIPVSQDNCWKTKRKKQYHRKPDYVKHSLILPYNYFNYWELMEYFDECNIPYKQENIYQRVRHYNVLTKKYYYYKDLTGVKFTWWYNKDIGLKYLLKYLRSTRR